MRNFIPVIKTHKVEILIGFTLFIIGFFGNFTYMFLKIPTGSTTWLMYDNGFELAVIDRMLKGLVLYRDLQFFYGPLLIYPFVIFLRIFGITLSNVIICKALIDGITLVALYFFAKVILKKRLSALLFIFSVLLVFFHNLFFSPGTPNPLLIRRFSGILPLLFLFYFYEKRSYKYVFWVGVTVGVAFLVSSDVGLAALVASLAMLILEYKTGFSAMFKFAKYFIFGVFLPITISLLYFWIIGGLREFIKYYLGFEVPGMWLLGYEGTPFGNLIIPIINILHNPGARTLRLFLDTYAEYFPILAIVTSLSFLLNRIVFYKNLSTAIKITIYLTVFMALFFRQAFGASSYNRVYDASLGLIFLLFVVFTNVNVKTKLAKFVVVIVLFHWIIYGGYVALRDKCLLKRDRSSCQVAYYPIGTEVNILDLPESGRLFLIEKSLGQEITIVVGYLKNHTKSSDMILSASNDPFYYFFLNNPTPGRYPVLFGAATSQERMELLASIKATPPKYILYNGNRVDRQGIPPNVYMPQIMDYIDKNYFLEASISGTQILRAKSSV